MQLSDPDKADGFALQQAQQQLERAYSDAQKTWQDGENAIEKRGSSGMRPKMP